MHWHDDVRFMIEADPSESCAANESKELAYVPRAEVTRLNPAESMVRMVRKTATLRR